MALTYTTRFGLPQWSDDTTDGPTMSEFNSAFAAVEGNAAFDYQGAGISGRAAPGNQGTYYTDTTTGWTYRDNGTAWKALNGLDNIPAVKAALGLGTASQANVGTTNGTVPVLGSGGVLPPGLLGSGTRNGANFLRDDGQYAAIPKQILVLKAGDPIPPGTPANTPILRKLS